MREAIGKAIATYKTRLAERNKRRLRKPRPSLCHVHPAVRVSLRISLPPCLLQLRTMEISHHLLLARLPTCWWVSFLQTTHSCIIFFEKTFRSSPFWRSWCRTSRYFRLATPTQQLEKFGMRTRQPDGERERNDWVTGLKFYLEILATLLKKTGGTEWVVSLFPIAHVSAPSGLTAFQLFFFFSSSLL